MKTTHLVALLSALTIGIAFTKPAESVITVYWEYWDYRIFDSSGWEYGNSNLLQGQGGFTETFHVYAPRPFTILQLFTNDPSVWFTGYTGPGNRFIDPLVERPTTISIGNTGGLGGAGLNGPEFEFTVSTESADPAKAWTLSAYAESFAPEPSTWLLLGLGLLPLLSFRRRVRVT